MVGVCIYLQQLFCNASFVPGRKKPQKLTEIKVWRVEPGIVGRAEPFFSVPCLQREPSLWPQAHAKHN